MLQRSREIYRNERKALIAHALVLWRNKPVREIRNYVDGDFSQEFAEVLGGFEGPIFYYSKKDQVTLRRWAAVLLGEGKDSKSLSLGEESQLQSTAYKIQMEYNDGYITPKELRKLAGMVESKSERVLSSSILTKWADAGIVERVRHGKYRFVTKAPEVSVDFDAIFKLFNETTASKDGKPTS